MIEAAIVDAFTESAFRGNPAAVALLEPGDRRPNGWMQQVAFELGLSETAFLSRAERGGFDLRWFTPTVEVDLCGHATLASAHRLLEIGAVEGEAPIVFHTASGPLTASRVDDGRISLDFPAAPVASHEELPGWQAALPGITATWVGTTAGRRPLARNALVVTTPDGVRGVEPDLPAMRRLRVGGFMVTAESDEPGTDIVSRYFAPAAGIDEDPVTGSMHCTLATYWMPRLGRDIIRARQLSPRGGELEVRRGGSDGRVALVGRAVTVARLNLLV